MVLMRREQEEEEGRGKCLRKKETRTNKAGPCAETVPPPQLMGAIEKRREACITHCAYCACVNKGPKHRGRRSIDNGCKKDP